MSTSVLRIYDRDEVGDKCSVLFDIYIYAFIFQKSETSLRTGATVNYFRRKIFKTLMYFFVLFL